MHTVEIYYNGALQHSIKCLFNNDISKILSEIFDKLALNNCEIYVNGQLFYCASMKKFVYGV